VLVIGDACRCAPSATLRYCSPMIADHTVGLASPFGGFTSSGIGREYGRERLEEYFELQSIAP
jgi:acyl-CoA reductase-like NAD-dependent aldehyde dehydrogenase